MNRRFALTVGAAVAAGAAGAGVGWWRSRAGALDAARDAAAATAASGADASAAIWSLHFDTPAGAQLPLGPLRGQPLLVNFWATWCPPCVGEMPLLDRFYADQRAHGWQVVGLAVDNLEPVRGFLAKRPVGYPIGLAGVEGVGLSRSLGNSAGALPFTIVFDRRGQVAQRKLGTIQPEDLTRWVSALA
ncbi:MAG TPA: TlpA disulfide reductase family protein [Burkholderiaceae bacterium]|jgi:thiol-disulfide isomerase/thioredoxin